MIPQDTVNLILDTARIEDIVGDFVTLKRRGANYVACCPFHNEKTPSFYVSPAKGIFKCFGCGKSGSAVGFVMEHEHCSYVEALRYMAKRYNIEVEEQEDDPEELIKRQRNESLLIVSEFAQKFFASQLQGGEGKSVGAAYFHSRGLEDATIAKFGLGWAPSGKTTLIDAALAQGYKLEYLIGAGLAVQDETGAVKDKFRERAMFPIHSVSGRVVAFSGRTLRSDNPAKYVNTAETEIYHKSNNLLGIYFAKAEIARQGRCILVEGNVDMVTMHQMGITNVVASCGTSLTIEQIRLIHKFTEDVTIMYDGDSAGIHAALRGISLVLAEGLNVRVVLLPDGDDPDSFCRKHTLDEVKDYISKNERDFISFKTDLLLSEAGGDPLKKANLINDIADTIAQIPDPVKRSTYVTATAGKFGIEADIVFGRITATRQHQLLEQKINQDRQRSREERQAVVEETDNRQTQTESKPSSWTEENKMLAKAEKDLLVFILRNGRDALAFPEDSEYRTESWLKDPSVASFIRAAIEDDGSVMENQAYRKTYDAYMALYDKGVDQAQIIKTLLDNPDRVVADVTADLSEYRYNLSVKSFKDSMMTTSSWLVFYVPKTILYYAERRIQNNIDNIRKVLAGAGQEKTEELLHSLIKLQGIHRTIKEKMGREKSE